MTKSEIKDFARWYAYELHKFTFKDSRGTEPTLKEYIKIIKTKYNKTIKI
tara:strand:+ start:1536 stop:1685 length:150 start_codon:yes stop_codon:yes gene_type:complete